MRIGSGKGFLFIVILFLSLPVGEAFAAQYLFLGHPRSFQREGVDARVRELDFTRYDMLLLGGDLSLHASRNPRILDDLDQIFHLNHPDTLWAIGNHDDQNRNRLKAFTKRNDFYRYQKNRIFFLVLNTQRDGGNIVDEQFQLLQSTIKKAVRSKASHLLILTHKLIWLRGNKEDPELAKYNHIADGQHGMANASFGACRVCTPETNFYLTIYPLLSDLKKRGVEVWVISGDMGATPNFSLKTKKGIQLIGSGIHENDPDPEVLVLTHDLRNQTLAFSFQKLQTLPKKNRQTPETKK